MAAQRGNLHYCTHCIPAALAKGTLAFCEGADVGGMVQTRDGGLGECNGKILSSGPKGRGATPVLVTWDDGTQMKFAPSDLWANMCGRHAFDLIKGNKAVVVYASKETPAKIGYARSCLFSRRLLIFKAELF